MGSRKKRNLKETSLFSLIAFAPFCFFLFIVYLPGVLLNVVIARDAPAARGIVWILLLVSFGLLVYFLFISCACFDRYMGAMTFGKRLLILYVGWILLSFPVIFLFLNALGGASMAVADGGAGSYAARLFSYLSATLTIVLWAHILFVPWIFLADLIINKFCRSMAGDSGA